MDVTGAAVLDLAAARRLAAAAPLHSKARRRARATANHGVASPCREGYERHSGRLAGERPRQEALERSVPCACPALPCCARRALTQCAASLALASASGRDGLQGVRYDSARGLEGRHSIPLCLPGM